MMFLRMLTVNLLLVVFAIVGLVLLTEWRPVLDMSVLLFIMVGIPLLCTCGSAAVYLITRPPALPVTAADRNLAKAVQS